MHTACTHRWLRMQYNMLIPEDASVLLAVLFLSNHSTGQLPLFKAGWLPLFHLSV